MTTPEITSIIALVVSTISLAIAGYNAFRDSRRLKVDAFFIEHSEYGPARIKVRAANIGRRPIVLRLVGGSDRAGKKFIGTYIDHENGGRRLGEGDSYEHVFDKESLFDFDIHEEDLFVYEQLYFEDAVGERYVIKESRAAIKKLLA